MGRKYENKLTVTGDPENQVPLSELFKGYRLGNKVHIACNTDINPIKFSGNYEYFANSVYISFVRIRFVDCNTIFLNKDILLRFKKRILNRVKKKLIEDRGIEPNNITIQKDLHSIINITINFIDCEFYNCNFSFDSFNIDKNIINSIRTDNKMLVNSLIYSKQYCYSSTYFDNIYPENVVLRRYTKGFGYKIISYKFKLENKSCNNIENKNLSVIIPLLVKIRIPEEATAVIPPFQFKSIKMRTNMLFIDDIYTLYLYDKVYDKGISYKKLEKGEIFKFKEHEVDLYNSTMEPLMYSSGFKYECNGLNRDMSFDRTSMDICSSGLHFFETAAEAIHFLELSVNPLYEYTDSREYIDTDKEKIGLLRTDDVKFVSNIISVYDYILFTDDQDIYKIL